MAKEEAHEAASGLSEIVDVDTSPLHECTTYARSLLNSGDKDRARIVLCRVVERDPTIRTPWVQLTQMAVDKGDLDEALQFNEKALSHFSDDVGLLRKKGSLLAASGRFTAAVRAMEETVKRFPDNLDAKSEYAKALLENGEAEKADAIFSDILEREPTNVLAINRKVDISIATGDLGRALVHLESKLFADVENRRPKAPRTPTEIQLWVRYMKTAALHSDADRTACAIKVLRDVVPDTPGNVLASLIRACHQIDDITLPEEIIKNVLERDALTASLAKSAMRWVCASTHYENAQSIMKNLRDKVVPTEREVFVAEAMLMLEGPEAAYKHARQSMHRTSHPNEAIDLARATMESGRAMLAARYLRFCALRWTSSKKIKDKLILTLLKAGDTQTARRILMQIADEFSENQMRLFWLDLFNNEGAFEDAMKMHRELEAFDETYAASSKCLRMNVYHGDLDRAKELFERVPLANQWHHRVTHVGSVSNELEIYRQVAGTGEPTLEHVTTFFHPAADVVRSASLGRPDDAHVDQAMVRNVFQYWDKTEPPPAIRDTMNIWSTCDGWDYARYDRKQALDWIRSTYGIKYARALRLTRQPAEQSDFLRLCLLEAKGGLYVDADDKLVGSPDRLLKGTKGAVVFVEEFGAVCNNVIYAPPHHPLITIARTMAFRALIGRDNDSVWAKTGPGMFTRATARFLMRKDHHPDFDITLLSVGDLKKEVYTHLKMPHKMTAEYWNSKTEKVPKPVNADWDGAAKPQASNA